MTTLYSMIQRTAIALSLSVGLVSISAAQQPQVLDEVAVIVNEGVVLESEITDMVNRIKRDAEQQNRSLPSDEALRTQVIDRLVAEELQMQMARRGGLEISDAQLDRALAEMAGEQGATVDEMREQVVADGTSWVSFREQVRQQIMTSEVQRSSVRDRVYVSPQEIQNLVGVIDEANQSEVEYRLGQILIGISDTSDADAVDQASEQAELVIERLEEGADFGDLAISVSSGREALERGDMGWMAINEMPTLFADAINGKSKGDLIGPLRSGVGFHILQVSDTRGLETVEIQEVKARHILIQPSVILSDKRAEEMLKEFYAQLQAGEAEFEELARENSADAGSAARGGDLGWATPDTYVEEFRRQVETLEIGELSEPFRSQFGWHIVQVEDRRVQDGTERSKQDRAYQMLFNRKYREELDNWQREIRDQAYVEVLEK